MNCKQKNAVVFSYQIYSTYFKINNKEEFFKRLCDYYSWLRVVDDKMEKDIKFGRSIYNYIKGNNENIELLDLTKKIKNYLRGKEAHLGVLYKLAEKELSEENLDKMLKLKKLIGRQTAFVAYLIVQDLIEGDKKEITRFTKKYGEVANVLDFLVDYRKDKNEKIGNFNYSYFYIPYIAIEVLKEGANFLLNYPKLLTFSLKYFKDKIKKF